MATWQQVADYLRGNYKIHKETDTFLTLRFGLPGNRSQFVTVKRVVGISHGDERSEWVEIISPVATVDQIDVARASEIAAGWLCGGIVIERGGVFVRHSAPLAALDTNELERPMSVLMSSADSIEKELLGIDRL